MSVKNKNWNAYYGGFNTAFAQIKEEQTDPERFPRDNRDQNGFWVPFKVHSIRGSFKCDIDPHFWHSNDIQVDLMVRYNFKLWRGEVKIVKEWRQTCSVHGGPLITPIFEKQIGARWIMGCLMQFIMARFYNHQNCISESESNSSPTSSPVSSSSKKSSPGSSPESSPGSGSGSKEQKEPPHPDHEFKNCEACQVGRCPRPQKEVSQDIEHQIPGAQTNKDMKVIAWALLDHVSWPSFVRAENNKRDVSEEEDKKKTLVLSPDIKSLSLYPSSRRTSKHQSKLGS